jgi:hypothetical protein
MVDKLNENTYIEALDAAQRELEDLQTKRAEIDARIARLRETVVSLAYLVNDEGQNENLDVSGIGLTDAVAKVLRLSGMALTPADIRDELARMGFDIKKYTDIIPNITKVLRRLHDKGHVDVSTTIKGDRKVYIWSPLQPPPPNRPHWGLMLNEAMEQAEKDIVLNSPPYAKGKNKSENVGTMLAASKPSTDGLSDAVLEILKTSKGEMTLAEIKDAAKRLGFSVKESSNFEARLNDVLKELDVVKRTNFRTNTVTYKLMTEEDKKKRDEYFRQKKLKMEAEKKK